MRPKLWDDTSPDAERVVLDAYRRMSPERKLHIVADLTVGVQKLSLAGMRQRNPEASDEELRWRVAELWLGTDLLARVRRYAAERGRA
ncbi:MAG: hypothetical protein ACOZNI_07775 [Myxococcota bacterium]